MKCDSCEHKEVCSKKEAYKAAYENLNKDIGEFEVEVKCKHYKNNHPDYLKQLQQQINKNSKPWPDYPNTYIGDIIPNP
jgi:hypothetical protein